MKQNDWQMTMKQQGIRATAQRWRLFWTIIVGLWVAASLLLMGQPAHASLTDDRYDGNIYPLYAGNGSLVPPRLTLEQSLARSDRPTLLVFYIDDSRDCKQYASVLSQLDAFYGRAADFILLDVDSLPQKEQYTPTEPSYYYSGFVPQTLIFDQSGEVVLNEVGIVPFERVDDKFREVFDLLPRSESVELKRRQVNEVNTELVPDGDQSDEEDSNDQPLDEADPSAE